MRGSREGWIKCESLHTIMKTFEEAFLRTSHRRCSRQTAAASAAGAAVWLRRRRARRSTISLPSLGRLLPLP